VVGNFYCLRVVRAVLGAALEFANADSSGAAAAIGVLSCFEEAVVERLVWVWGSEIVEGDANRGA
jgi:hypothetical protein